MEEQKEQVEETGKQIEALAKEDKEAKQKLWGALARMTGGIGVLLITIAVVITPFRLAVFWLGLSFLIGSFVLASLAHWSNQ